jgi:hypothetical protein
LRGILKEAIPESEPSREAAVPFIATCADLIAALLRGSGATRVVGTCGLPGDGEPPPVEALPSPGDRRRSVV